MYLQSHHSIIPLGSNAPSPAPSLSSSSSFSSSSPSSISFPAFVFPSPSPTSSDFSFLERSESSSATPKLTHQQNALCKQVLEDSCLQLKEKLTGLEKNRSKEEESIAKKMHQLNSNKSKIDASLATLNSKIKDVSAKILKSEQSIKQMEEELKKMEDNFKSQHGMMLFFVKSVTSAEGSSSDLAYQQTNMNKAFENCKKLMQRKEASQKTLKENTLTRDENRSLLEGMTKEKGPLEQQSKQLATQIATLSTKEEASKKQFVQEQAELRTEIDALSAGITQLAG